VGRFILIDVIVASTLLGLWYAWFIHYNRRRAADVLQWVQAACLGKGRVADLRWQASSSRLKATLHLSSRWFEDAHLTIRLLPRPLPVQWAMSRWRQQQETLTFEANMGFPPGLPSRRHPSSLVGPHWSERLRCERPRFERRRFERLEPRSRLDHQPPGPCHSDHQGRLARRTQPGGECFGVLARQEFCRRPVQLHLAALHRHSSARKSLRSESGGRLARPLPRIGRQFLSQAALRKVIATGK